MHHLRAVGPYSRRYGAAPSGALEQSAVASRAPGGLASRPECTTCVPWGSLLSAIGAARATPLNRAPLLAGPTGRGRRSTGRGRRRGNRRHVGAAGRRSQPLTREGVGAGRGEELVAVVVPD